MKKFLSPVSLAALAFCFTLQGSYAMKRSDDEFPPSMKKLLQEDQAKNAEVPSTNGLPFSSPNVFSAFFKDILLPGMAPHFPENQIQGLQYSNTILKPKMWELRLVCQDWRRVVNSHVTHLDLSPRYWVPFQKRAQLVKASGHAQIESLTFSKRQDMWHISHDQRGEIEIQAEALWRTKEFWFKSYWDPVPNPLIEYFTNITVDPLDFPNLHSVVLRDNIGISDKLLKKFINLTYLDLENNKVITGKSLSKLININHLILDYNDIDYSECLELPCLGILQYIWDSNDCWNIKRQQEMYVAERLFLMIEKDETKRKDPDFQALKKKYEIKFLLPNIYDLGSEKRKSTYPYPDNVLYKKEDLEYIMKLTAIKNKSKDGVLDDDDFDVYEGSYGLRKIIDGLIKISGKNLEICWDNDSYHVYLFRNQK